MQSVRIAFGIVRRQFPISGAAGEIGNESD
jgi:hypothetical protein